MYEYPYTGNKPCPSCDLTMSFVLIINNLIPPFIMQEKDVQVKYIPKTHMAEPDEDDHAIVFPETKLQTPLQLWGVFS